MKRLLVLCLFACLAAQPVPAAPKQQRGYQLRDTTSLPPPATGMARLVVARDQQETRTLKPEFLFVDRTPLGMLAQKTAVAAEVGPGWHRVWLGRGSGAEVWMEFVPDGRYLLRLREGGSTGTWKGDLVRESADGYAKFALGKDMQLSVLDESGRGSLERDLETPTAETAMKDSTARARAIQLATLPITLAEAWYEPVPSDAPPGEHEANVGTLRLDETSLRFMHGDSVVVEVQRAGIKEVRYGSQKGGKWNAWVKVSYRQDGISREVAFADAQLQTSTENYNRLFAELARSVP